jgi:hypothetical protein
MSFWKKLYKKIISNPKRPAPKPRRRLFLEPLEGRLAPAGMGPPVLTVDTAQDVATSNTVLSLRMAMLIADGQLDPTTLALAVQAQIQGTPTGSSYDIIQFDINNGPVTIKLGSALPTLSAGPVDITGVAPATKPNQMITLDGQSMVNGPGINLSYTTDQIGSVTATTAGSTIVGLTIQDVLGPGIRVASDHNTIGGGNAVGQGNALTGDYIGILITGERATNNTVIGNTVTSNVAVKGNDESGWGVRIEGGAASNWIGATAATDPKTNVITNPVNVISGNKMANVVITDALSNRNTVVGNFIGLDANGKAMSNGAQGVAIVSGASNNQIGGPAPGAMNVISANPGGGVRALFTSM